jgi:hypothetical protein
MRRPSGHGKAASGLSPAPSLPPTSRQHQDHVAGGRRRARLRFARARTYIRGMDLEYWTMELKAAELELDAATRLSDVNLAAQRLQRAKAALRRLDQRRPSRRTALVVPRARRTLPQHLLGFVYLEARRLQVLDHPGSELLASIVRRVLCQDPAE